MTRNKWRRTDLNGEIAPDDWTLLDPSGEPLARFYKVFGGPQNGQWYWTVDTGGEFGDGRKSRALRHFDSRMRMSLRESRRFLIDNLSFHLILQSMDGHVTSIAPNRPDS